VPKADLGHPAPGRAEWKSQFNQQLFEDKTFFVTRNQMLKIKTVLLLLSCCALAVAQNSGETSTQSNPPRPQLIRISAGILHGLADHVELPKYPEEALKSRIEGSVTFKVVVDELGKVILSTPVEGDSLLVAASLDALRNFRFRPYLLNGKPLRVESQVGFHFALKGNGENTSGNVEYASSVPYRPEFRTGVVTDTGVLVLQPQKISGPEPQLPSDLARKSGSVYLTVTIGVDGKVQDIKVIGGDEPFINPVVAAVKQFVYEPQLVVCLKQIIDYSGQPERG
jgi:TonB family protein